MSLSWYHYLFVFNLIHLLTKQESMLIACLAHAFLRERVHRYLHVQRKQGQVTRATRQHDLPNSHLLVRLKNTSGNPHFSGFILQMASKKEESEGGNADRAVHSKCINALCLPDVFVC